MPYQYLANQNAITFELHQPISDSDLFDTINIVNGVYNERDDDGDVIGGLGFVLVCMQTIVGVYTNTMNNMTGLMVM